MRSLGLLAFTSAGSSSTWWPAELRLGRDVHPAARPFAAEFARGKETIPPTRIPAVIVRLSATRPSGGLE